MVKTNSTNINETHNHISHQTIEHIEKTTTYHVENSSHFFGQEQKIWRVETGAWVSNLPPLNIWMSNENADLRKQYKCTNWLPFENTTLLQILITIVQ